MVSEKAGYWMAVGVLALFLSNHFAAPYEGGVQRLASRSMATVEQISGHATRLMGMAEMMLGRSGSHFARTQTTLASAQTRLASMQTVLAKHEAIMARVQAEHARIEALQELRGSAMICPRQNLVMTMPRLHSDGTI